MIVSGLILAYNRRGCKKKPGRTRRREFRSINGNHRLSDDQVIKMAELLDEVSPKGVFKQLSDELRRKMKKKMIQRIGAVSGIKGQPGSPMKP